MLKAEGKVISSHHKTTIEIARRKTDSEKSKKCTSYSVKIPPSHMALSKHLQLNISPTATDPREKKNVIDHKKEALENISHHY